MLNAQYCDEVIARSYPELGKQVKHRTVHNALVITAGRVQLATAEGTSWKVAMDKSGVSWVKMSTAVCERGSVQISKMELDSPEDRHMELSELSDYPPRNQDTPGPLSTHGWGLCSSRVEGAGCEGGVLFPVSQRV